MTGSGAFAAVVREVSQGATAGAAARSLGVPVPLAESIVDEAERLGLLVRFGAMCAGCPGTGAPCDGCPLTGRRPEA